MRSLEVTIQWEEGWGEKVEGSEGSILKFYFLSEHIVFNYTEYLLEMALTRD